MGEQLVEQRRRQLPASRMLRSSFACTSSKEDILIVVNRAVDLPHSLQAADDVRCYQHCNGRNGKGVYETKRIRVKEAMGV